MKLTINYIMLVDLERKEARKVTFSSGRNFLTSEINHLGKSSIIKSLYYTLGADVYFSKPWKDMNFFSYIHFNLDDTVYMLSRYGYSFCLYRDENLYKCFHSVATLGEELSSLFRLRIELVSKDAQSTIMLCPPAFYYMPFYIDQENGWSTNSYSFASMTQFDLPQRKDVYMFQLGVLDNQFSSVQKKKKAAQHKLDDAKNQIEKLVAVIDTIGMGLDESQVSFDIASLNAVISKWKMEQTQILSEIEKYRKDIVTTDSTIAHLKNEKEILSKYIKIKRIPETEERQDLVECPRCGTVFKQTLVEKLEKTYLLDSLNEDYGKIIAEIQKQETHLSRCTAKFTDQQHRLEAYDREISTENDTYQRYIRYKSTRELINEYNTKIGEYRIDCMRAEEAIKEAISALSSYKEHRDAAIQLYNEYLNKLLLEFDVPSSQIETDLEPGAYISAAGAYGPRCKIAQIFAFIQTQNILANSVIKFPIVIDSPNALEQDTSHLTTIMKKLLSWNETPNQIIVSSINGRSIASSIDDANVIELTNDKNHVLDSSIYLDNEPIIMRYFMNH